MAPEQCGVLIVGGGPAGLAAALELAQLGVHNIRVIERENEAGGVPRLCHHTGFGWRDLRRWHSGPGYARSYRERVLGAGVVLQTATTVTGWAGPRTVNVTGPAGVRQLQAEAILLATGCRERPPAARLVSGNRPQGVFTTGSLQRFVHEHEQRVGRRAVVVGAELVSLSALWTLAGAGISVAAMITEHPHHQLYFPFTPVLWYATRRLGVPIITQASIHRIVGRQRVEALEYTHLDTGEVASAHCDTIVFTGKWIPEHELARSGGLVLDPATRGPQVDAGLRTSAPGVFAAGNLLRGAQTADQAALEGRRAAHAIAQFLADSTWPQGGVALAVEAPIAWVAPNRVSSTSLPGQTPFIFQCDRFCRNADVRLFQGARLRFAQRVGNLTPNRSYVLPDRWLKDVDLGGEGLLLTLA